MALNAVFPRIVDIDFSPRIQIPSRRNGKFSRHDSMQFDNILSIRQSVAIMSLTAITDLVLETFRLNGRLIAAGDALVADIGLTSARWQVLGAMALSPVPLPVASIARNMGLSRQAVQRLSKEMEGDGLLQFGPNPHHQRAKLVLLTRQGKTAFEAAMQRQAPWANDLAIDMTTREIETTANTLRKIRQRLENQVGYGGANA